MSAFDDEALRSARAAVEINGNSPAALARLGAYLVAAERCDEAVAYLRRALAIDPDCAEVHNNLGSALLALGKAEDGMLRLRRAIELVPGYVDAHYNLGNTLHRLERFEEAIPHFEVVAAARPDDAGVLVNLGITLREMGRLDEAHTAYARAIALEPLPHVFHLLSDVHTFAAGDPHLAAIETLANTSSLNVEQQIDVHFALGKAYADTHEYRRSFEHLLAGNALKRGIVEYGEAATLASFATIPRVFTREALQAHRDEGDPSAVPVFVLGMPRSGTTLIEQILAGHPDVHAAGELGLFDEALAFAFPGSGEPLSGARLRALGAHYFAAVRALAPQAKRITDKMPANFRYAGLINLALPNARIVYARRDPIDTCLSCFSLLFQDGQEHTYDLAELGRYYRGQAALMEHWRTVLPPGVMLDVQYEDVVADMETQARRIVAHLGLPWNDACLAFHRIKRPILTSSAAQVRKPIYSTSVGRWRPYADYLQPLFDALQIERPLD